ncbi:MAG TPA: phosphohistidine phosphatase SixA [Candidatus Baltobacteraceae bacterium]|jgi:phosphohistidine phosphatase|nr:phosphohistidine phosphatase SixA [Candidatus Baltobacteraceae bacterium]
MLVYFVRHGIAEDGATFQGSDAERPLTAKGSRKMAEIGKRLAELDLKPNAILTSPLVRARQTAEIVATELRLSARVGDDERLAGGFNVQQLGAILSERTDADGLMLVGHEPAMSAVIGHVTGDARVEMKKGAVACVEFSDPASARGVLLWLATPKILIG